MTVLASASDTYLPLIIAVIGSGGLIGGIAAFLKLRPEKDSIVVNAAQGALLVQTGIVEQLRLELERAHTRIAACEGLEARVDELEAELRKRDAVVADLVTELHALKNMR